LECAPPSQRTFLHGGILSEERALIPVIEITPLGVPAPRERQLNASPTGLFRFFAIKAIPEKYISIRRKGHSGWIKKEIENQSGSP
jgi:hypothetical protein